MFRTLRERISRASDEAAGEIERDIKRGRKVSGKRLDEVLWPLEVALLEADVALPVVEELKAEMKRRLGEARFSRREDIESSISAAFRESLVKMLGKGRTSLVKRVEDGERPFVIMFVGVNGTGKTTTIAKVANRLQKRELTVVLAAADTFRAGAIEQLQLHGERLGCRVIQQKAGSDPAAVAYDAIEHARARRRDVVLIDTAGRMQTNSNLMDELAKVKRIAKPHMTIFVGDSLAGNDAIEQARRFEEAIGLDGVILCKVDADAKGGSALSITHTIGKPVLYLCVGQGYDDIVPFQPKWLIERILGEGDPPEKAEVISE